MDTNILKNNPNGLPVYDPNITAHGTEAIVRCLDWDYENDPNGKYIKGTKFVWISKETPMIVLDGVTFVPHRIWGEVRIGWKAYPDDNNELGFKLSPVSVYPQAKGDIKFSDDFLVEMI